MKRLLLIPLALLLVSCGENGSILKSGTWVEGPDSGRKVFCITDASYGSTTCDWVGYHKNDPRP